MPRQDAADGRYQKETLEYAVGDDLVVCGVAYARSEWQLDNEGGIERRRQVDVTYDDQPSPRPLSGDALRAAIRDAFAIDDAAGS